MKLSLILDDTLKIMIPYQIELKFLYSYISWIIISMCPIYLISFDGINYETIVLSD